jgi:CHAT domain-containing protein
LALQLYQETGNLQNQAIVLENLARVHQQFGQTSQAISYWEQVVEIYRQAKNYPQMGRKLVEQAQAHNRLGQYRQAMALLCGAPHEENCRSDSAVEIARRSGDRAGEAAALGSLGETYRLRGQIDQAIKQLEQSLRLAQEIGQPVYQMAALSGLGNAYAAQAQADYRRSNTASQIGEQQEAKEFKQRAQQADQTALNYFQQSADFARSNRNPFGQLRALLNAIPSYYRIDQPTEATAVWQQALPLLDALPESQTKVFTAINLVKLLQPLSASEPTTSRTRCLSPDAESQAENLLQQGLVIARNLQDSRTESFVLGELGHLQECRKNYQQALELTQQAQWAADQGLSAKDSLYLWFWQAGRILRAEGQTVEAINAYEQATQTLESIRNEILAASRDQQFDFRDAVEPIYRELIGLRLNQERSTSPQVIASKANINAVLNTFDSLKLAELQNYFGDDCVVAPVDQGVDLTRPETATAVFNSIILDDRTAVILTLPDGTQKIAWIDRDPETLRNEINEFRKGLERFFEDYNPQPAQKVYNWMIRPFEQDLGQAQIKTLLFIQDGILRSVPMAALHDGNQFLVQNYAIATTPSLALTESQAISRQDLRALVLGLSKDAVVDGQTFPALNYVERELSSIQAELPGSKELLNEDFTRDQLQQALSQNAFSIIHIATHGEFGTESKDTFLITGNNEKLTITDLDQLIRNKAQNDLIELLSLTACETAIGDDRATLGLAGVSVQAGAKSALASLWSVEDAATAQIVTQFYSNLRNSQLSKAEALRTAQLALLQSGQQWAHPAYWAPFILIGNWL